MREINIRIDTRKFVIRVSNGYKIFVGNNIVQKDLLLNTINHILNFEKLSQFDIETSLSLDLAINGMKINKSNLSHYFFSQSWSLEKDFKLGSKSIMKDYIISLLPRIELSDDLRLVNQMIDSLNNEHINNIEVNTDTHLSVNLSPIVGNTFLKLIEAQIINNELPMNDRNIDMYERLVAFLELIVQIATHKQEKLILVTLHLPVINNKILNILTKFRTDNLITLIFSDIIYTSVNYEDIFVVNLKNIDLGSEKDLYNLILNKGIGTNLTECIDLLNKQLTQPTCATAYNTSIIDFINSL